MVKAKFFVFLFTQFTSFWALSSGLFYLCFIAPFFVVLFILRWMFGTPRISRVFNFFSIHFITTLLIFFYTRRIFFLPFFSAGKMF